MLDKLSSNGKGILKGCIACRAVTEERTILFAVCCCWWLNDAFFLHKLQQRLPILVRGSDNPQKCLFPRGILTPSNPWFLGPTWVSLQTASRSVQPFLHSTSLWLIHRHTHRHAKCYICSNMPHLMHCMHATQPKNRLLTSPFLVRSTSAPFTPSLWHQYLRFKIFFKEQQNWDNLLNYREFILSVAGRMSHNTVTLTYTTHTKLNTQQQPFYPSVCAAMTTTSRTSLQIKSHTSSIRSIPPHSVQKLHRMKHFTVCRNISQRPHPRQLQTRRFTATVAT